MIINKYIYTITLWIFILLVPFYFVNVEWYHLLITYFVYWMLGDGVMSIFLHRWAAHGLWICPKWLQKVLATLGVMSLIGNPISWAAWHRTHHKHTDTEKDPHSPKYNNWFYIVFLNHFHNAEYRRGVDRARDKYFVFLSKYEGFIAVATAIILYFVLPWQWFLTLWVVPVAMLGIFPGLIVNYFCHANNQPRNRILFWPLAFSECMHKEHHENVKLKRSCWDPLATLIQKIGLEKA